MSETSEGALANGGAGPGTSWPRRILSTLLLYVPDVEVDNFCRCENCNMELVRVIPEDSLPKHLGHKLHSVNYLCTWERIWIKLGWL